MFIVGPILSAVMSERISARSYFLPKYLFICGISSFAIISYIILYIFHPELDFLLFRMYYLDGIIFLTLIYTFIILTIFLAKKYIMR